MTKLEVLKERNFRWFFLGATSSLLGDELIPVALAFAVIRTGTASDLGVVLAARTIPLMVFMLLGGVLADRLPRRSVMLGADIVRACGQGALAVLLVTQHAHVSQIAALQAVHGTASALFMPAITGLVQETVPKERLNDANALRSLTQSAARMAGPALAGVLVVTAGPGWAIGVDAMTFGVSAACLSRLPRTVTAARLGPRDLVRDLGAGWREFVSHRWVWTTITVASLMNMFQAAYTVLGPVIAATRLGGAASWGLVLTSFGVGCVLGGFASLWARVRFPLRTAVLTVGLFPLPILGLALRVPLPALALSACLGGAGLIVFNTLWETTLQQQIPADRLARVSAYEWLGSIACQPLGLLVIPWVAAGIGPDPVLWSAGLGMLALSSSLLLVRDVRNNPVRQPAILETADLDRI